MAMFAVVSMAQVNFQLHYDLGRNINSEAESNRQKVTSTVEMYHPDATGSTVQAMLKQYIKKDNLKGISSFQLTGVWSTTFAKGLCTFSGFADLWYGYTPRYDDNGSQKKGWVFITEPQFWFNIVGKDRQHGKFSIGTEWELSNDFIWATNSKKTFFFNPTIAAKYVF